MPDTSSETQPAVQGVTRAPLQLRDASGTWVLEKDVKNPEPDGRGTGWGAWKVWKRGMVIEILPQQIYEILTIDHDDQEIELVRSDIPFFIAVVPDESGPKNKTISLCDRKSTIPLLNGEIQGENYQQMWRLLQPHLIEENNTPWRVCLDLDLMDWWAWNIITKLHYVMSLEAIHQLLKIGERMQHEDVKKVGKNPFYLNGLHRMEH